MVSTMRVMSAYDTIAMEYGGMPDGSALSGQLCPSCSGGTRAESSLSVSVKDGMVLFHCHRATCSFSGMVPADGSNRGTVNDKPKRKYPLIQGNPLEVATTKLLCTKYNITQETLEFANLRWTGDGDGPYARRVGFPIFDPKGEERGVSYRTYMEGVQPKAIVELRSPDDIKACWYKMFRKSDTLVLVEDQMSALKLSPYTHTLALLGVDISEALVEEIVEHGYKDVFISLDPDAVGQAIKLQLRLRNKIKGLLVAAIPRDVKDFSPKEMEQYVQDHL